MSCGKGAGAKVFARETIVIALGIVVVWLVFYHVSHKKVRFKALSKKNYR